MAGFIVRNDPRPTTVLYGTMVPGNFQTTFECDLANGPLSDFDRIVSAKQVNPAFVLWPSSNDQRSSKSGCRGDRLSYCSRNFD